MKTQINYVGAIINKKENHSRNRVGLVTFFTFLLLIFSSGMSFAHCDTMDGPLISDAKKAISRNNVNIVLKWVPESKEAEITKAFEKVMETRELSEKSKLHSEKEFFETLVRIHREGEGVAYTGIKPHGTPIDEKIKAADKSIELGNLSPLEGLVDKKDFPELTRRFNKVMQLKKFDDSNVKAGREYIEAYVLFFKFAEGEEDGHNAHRHQKVGHSKVEGSSGHVH